MNAIPLRELPSSNSRDTKALREREVLRVAGELGKNRDSKKAIEMAQAEVLEWATEQVNSRLPDSAFKGLSFEHFQGGRTCIATGFEDSQKAMWALRVDRPDTTVAQRMWTTEIVVGHTVEGEALFSLRLLATSPEKSLEIAPAVPKLVKKIANKCGLNHNGISFLPYAHQVKDEADVDRLIEALINPSRSVPFIVFSQGARDSIQKYQADSLANATMGIARIILLPANLSRYLTQQLGRDLSAFSGAARAYMPSFSADDNPYLHRRFVCTSTHRDRWEEPLARLKWLAASESLRRRELGWDVVAFSSVREISLDFERARLKSTGSADQIQLSTALAQINALKEDLRRSNSESDQWMQDYERADQESRNFEQQLRASQNRIQQLLFQIKQRGEEPDAGIQLPTTWEEFGDWCDETLSGRVKLSTRARREVKSPSYESPETAAKCLLWLANEYRDSRIKGSDGDLRKPLEEGVHNDRCGSDSFDFSWNDNKKISVEWHIKGGGNTRDPRRCLRIYYFWDEEQQLVVIASMPAHIRTGAT